MSVPVGTPNFGPTQIIISQWEDLNRDGFTTRAGATAPAFSTGFAGNAGLAKTVWAKTGSEYIYFQIQFKHATKVGSRCYPHIHFSPIDATTGAVKFILEYSSAAINGAFGTSQTYPLTATVSSDKTWAHLIAGNSTGIVTTGMSEVWNCAITRDNSVASNLDQVLAHLYFDIHYELDTVGSSQVTTK